MNPPSWPHCGKGAGDTDPVGCRGVRVPGHDRCLAHLSRAEQDAHFAALTPGQDVDHRGTAFTERLLGALLHALRDPATGTSRLGAARFRGATFTGDARFDRARFTGAAWFSGATFTADARFGRAVFDGAAWFGGASFAGTAGFGGATFTADARFGRVTVTGAAEFRGARFTGNADFGGASFAGGTRFGSAVFAKGAEFRAAAFAGNTWFSGATFTGDTVFADAGFAADVRFSGAAFTREAGFERTSFAGVTRFDRVTFAADARFGGAVFTGDARFGEAVFTGDASFDRATFLRDAEFSAAGFAADARFDGAVFTGEAGFGHAAFAGDTAFTGTRFESASTLGPLTCEAVLTLSGAVFAAPVEIRAGARRVVCRRTRWESTATLRVRGDVDLTDAVLSAPLAVTAHPPFTRTPFTRTPFASPLTHPAFADVGGAFAKAGPDEVRVLSLRGADAQHLVLTDADLTVCAFTGAFHLDQIRLEGRVLFARPPTGTSRRHGLPLRWTRRRTVAEEHHWRALHSPPADPATPTDREWTPGPHHPDPEATPGPDDLAPVYRQLRKALEDAKNEPGAADFYYGEMEMRRKDKDDTSRAERILLTAYWALSGYGLRATRALTWLAATMTGMILALMLWGLPTREAKPLTTGTVTDGRRIELVTDTPGQVARGPLSGRLTGARAKKAARITAAHVLLRASGQNLTPAGGDIEMASRLVQPALGALAVLAIRGRVKR